MRGEARGARPPELPHHLPSAAAAFTYSGDPSCCPSCLRGAEVTPWLLHLYLKVHAEYIFLAARAGGYPRAASIRGGEYIRLLCLSAGYRLRPPPAPRAPVQKVIHCRR